MRRAHLITAGVLLAFVAVGGWTLWWFFLATYAERIVRSAGAEDARPRLEFASLERGGFPFEIVLRMGDVRATSAWGAGQLVLTAPEAVARLAPWDFNKIRYDLPNGLAFAAEGAAPGQAVTGTAAFGQGVASSTPSPTVTLSLSDIRAAPATTAPLRARSGEIVLREQGPETRALDLAFRDIELAETALFGPTAALAHAIVVADGRLPVDGDPAEIARWRDAGGAIRVESAKVLWGALDLDATGVLSLDDAFRPSGELDIGVGNHAALIGRLEAQGLLQAQAGMAAKTLLGISALGNGGRARAPLLLADGKATLAGFALSRLEPVCACR